MVLESIKDKRVIKGFDLVDSLPLLIEDSDEIVAYFKDSKILPYSYTETGTANSLRVLLNRLARLSQTHSACISRKLDLGFTGTITLAYDDLYSDVVDSGNVDYNEYRRSAAFVKYGKQGVFDYFKDVAQNYLTFGECFIELFLYQDSDKWYLSHRVMPGLGSYIYKDKGMYYVYIPQLNREDTKEILPFYPDFVESGIGMKSILHIKNGNYIYGEPATLGSIYQQYNELQLSVYNNKQTDNNFMGVTILEVEGDNPETGIGMNTDSYDISSGQVYSVPKQSVASKFVDATTNKGKSPQSIIYMERPAGASGMQVHTVSPVTNEAYFRSLGEMNRDAIIMSHKLPGRLLGVNQSVGWNTDAYKDEFLIAMETVIANLQRAILEPHDKVIDDLNEMNGFGDLKGIRRSVLHPLVNFFTNKEIQ